MSGRTLTAAARELQSASNRLALAEQNQSRDTILAGIFPGQVKGNRAALRLEYRAADIRALRRDVNRLRAELATMLDQLDNKSRIH